MGAMSDTPKAPRVVLSGLPEEYRLPSKVAGGGDAFRQTSFLLGDELALFERQLNLQLEVLAANRKLRGAQGVALYTLWSRAFSHLADACSLMCGGSYVSCFPLLRVALDTIAVERSLAADGFAEYEEWFAGGISQDRKRAAVAFDIGRSKGASTVIGDERLDVCYRLLMHLSLPHFGTTALLTAPEAGLQRLAPGFDDRAFHLGLAQLASGWLLLLADEQVRAAIGSGVLEVEEELAERIGAVGSEVSGVLQDNRRCYVEDADGRFVLHNFRRAASGQPKRVVLG